MTNMTKTYHSPNISCGHCAAAIKEALAEVQGVESVEVDVENKQVTVALKPGADEQVVKDTLAEEGYPAQ